MRTHKITYTPDEQCVELKSLKLYLWSYRDEGAFHEAVTNRIADDIMAAVNPRKLKVEGDFYIRGGIRTVVTVTHEKQMSVSSFVIASRGSLALWQAHLPPICSCEAEVRIYKTQGDQIQHLAE